MKLFLYIYLKLNKEKNMKFNIRPIHRLTFYLPAIFFAVKINPLNSIDALKHTSFVMKEGKVIGQG